MFETLRRMILPIIVIVLFFFVAMIVLQWGLDMGGQGRFGADARYAGEINGEAISWDAYQATYSNLYQQATAETDEELGDRQIEQIEQQAWNQIVSDRLLTQQASQYDIAVTDDDLYFYLSRTPPDYIQAYPPFQTDGRFDYQKYVGAMADPQWAAFWTQVEPQARAELRKAKLQQLILETASVSEAEIREAFVAAAESVKVELINIATSKVTTGLPDPTDEELQAYFEQHYDRYSYAYERAAVDLVTVSKSPTEGDWDIERAKAARIRDSVLAGSDFGEMARIYSEDVASARDDGSLGWFEPGRMVGAFDSVVFAMEPGDISEPVRTRFGYHVIKLHEFREEGEKREAHASHILFKAKASQQSLDSLYNVLQDVRLQADTDGLEKAAEDAGLRVQTTRPLAREASIQQIGGRSAATTEFAFTEEPGAMTGVLESDAYFFMARVNRQLGANTAEYGEVEGRVKFDLTRDQKITICLDSANAIWQAIQNGADFQTAAEQHGQVVETPPAITRGSTLPGIGRNPQALGVAFRLSQPGEKAEPVSYGNGVVLFSLLERWSPELTAFTEKRDSVASAVLVDKQRLLYDQWYRDLVDQSEIINNVELQRSEAARSS